MTLTVVKELFFCVSKTEEDYKEAVVVFRPFLGVQIGLAGFSSL